MKLKIVPGISGYCHRLLFRLFKLRKKCLRWIMWRFFAHRGYPNPRLLINETELRPHYCQALQYLKEKVGAEKIGDYLEFGVCNGTSLQLMYNELLNAKLSHIRLFGFDSFAGLPFDEEGIWQEGSFSADFDNVVKSLDDRGINWKRVTLVKGYYSDTLTGALIAKHRLYKASMIMIDCDMYSSTKEALDFCRPFILDEAIIFFDDWNPAAQRNKGEKRAFDEFLQNNREFEAVPIGAYSYSPGDLHGKVFRVFRTRSK